MAFEVQPIVVGDTPDFTYYAQKDGKTWDITGAAIVIYFKKPDETVVGPFSGSVSDGPRGIAHYQAPDTLLDQEGDWIRQWKITLGAIVMWSRDIEFSVDEALGA